jgi:hypothetical protein
VATSLPGPFGYLLERHPLFAHRVVRRLGDSGRLKVEGVKLRPPAYVLRSFRARRLVTRHNSRQWSPGTRQAVDKTKWRGCEGCGRVIPVVFDWTCNADGKVLETATWTYVCPHCSHCHVGTLSWTQNRKSQLTCHECGATLGESYQCTTGSFPRGWMRVDCPYCKNRQPIFAPHWVASCDMFRLEWVRCESVFNSLCIC